MLVQYLRDENRVPIGCIVADVYDNMIFYGVSYCNTKKDKFKKSIGRKIAYDRMYKNMEMFFSGGSKKITFNPVARERTQAQEFRFLNRCTKYFRTDYIVD